MKLAKLSAISIFLAVIVSAGCSEKNTEKPKKERKVLMKGKIVIKLDSEKAPLSSTNFKKYVESDFFKGTIFHRVIPGFVVQGGGFTPAMDQKNPNDPIKNEANNGLSNIRGSVAMARTQVVDSATSQFYINLKDNTMLDHKGKDDQNFGYCVFGMVTEGLDFVDKIAAVKTGNTGFHRDVPETPIVATAVSMSADGTSVTFEIEQLSE